MDSQKYKKKRSSLRLITSTDGAPTYRLAKNLAGLLGSCMGNSPYHV
jgi:hypothetical protein